MTNRMKANTVTKSRIPQPTLITRHRVATHRENGYVVERGMPLHEISNETTFENKETKPETVAQSSNVSTWKTVKPNIAFKTSQNKDKPLRKVRERLETQESKIEQVEQTTKSYEEQQCHYQQQVDILVADVKNLEEQIAATEELIQNLEDELLLATRELETIQQNRKEKEEQIDILKVEKSVIQGQIQVEEAKIQSIQSRIEEQRAILNNIYDEQLSLQKQIQSEKCRNQDELFKLEEMTGIEANLEKDITRMKMQQEEFIKHLSQLDNERAEIIQQLERLKEDFYRQQREIHENEEEESAIEIEIADLKFREESYPQRKQELEQEIVRLRSDWSVVERNIQELKATLSQKENECKAKQDALEDLRESSERVLSVEKRKLSSIQSQLEQSKANNEQMQQSIKKKQEDAEYFSSAIDQQHTLLVSLRNKLSTLELKLEEERNIHLIEQQKLNALQERMQRQQSLIDEMKQQRQSNGEIQQDLQRKVYEMRPNMQVFCKLDDHSESTSDSLQHLLLLDIQNSEVVARKLQGSKEVSSSIFPFDYVFDVTTSQDEIFRHFTAFVDQIWKERNVCIFGYAMQTHQRKLFFDVKEGLAFLTLLHLLESINGNYESRFALVVQFFHVWKDELEDIFSSTRDNITENVQTKEQGNRNETRNLTAIEISNATQLEDCVYPRMNSQKLESQLGHFVLRISIKDQGLQPSDTKSSITFIHLQTPDMYDKESLQTHETEKNFVSLLQLLTQLANRDKSGISHSSNCIFTNEIFRSLNENPKLVSILQIPKTTNNIQSTLQLLNLGQKLNCCEIVPRKTTNH